MMCMLLFTPPQEAFADGDQWHGWWVASRGADDGGFADAGGWHWIGVWDSAWVEKQADPFRKEGRGMDAIPAL